MHESVVQRVLTVLTYLSPNSYFSFPKELIGMEYIFDLLKVIRRKCSDLESLLVNQMASLSQSICLDKFHSNKSLLRLISAEMLRPAENIFSSQQPESWSES